MIATRAPSRLWRTDPDGTYRIVPSSDPQRDFIESLAHEILFSGHWGNGKTVAICVKIILLAHLYPGIKIALVRREYAHLRLSTLRHFRDVLGDALYFAGLRGGERPERYDFENGSFVDFIGMSGDNDGTTKLLSTEYGAIACDECNEMSEAQWEIAIGRLRQFELPNGTFLPIRQIFGACNPDGPHHWLYRRFRPALGSNKQHGESEACVACKGTGRAMRYFLDDETQALTREMGPCEQCEGTGKIEPLIRECFVAGARDNDENQPADYLRFKRTLTGIRGQRYRDGLWVAYEGSVFEMYDPTVHVLGPDRMRDLVPSWEPWGWLPPPDWERTCGIDLGFINPFCCLWIAKDPDGRKFVYRQLYISRVTIDVLARRIADIEAAEISQLRAAATPDQAQTLAPYLTELYVRFRACDHDRGERAILDRELLERGLRPTIAARKDIDGGLQKLFRRLEPSQPGGPRLFIIQDCNVEPDQPMKGAQLPTCLEEEMPLYRYEKAPTTGERAGVAKSIPVDRENHAIDALRYEEDTDSTSGRPGVY